MSYWSNSEDDLKAMLEAIGVENFEALIKNIPEDLRFKGAYNLPEGISELEARQLLEEMAEKNRMLVPFAGGGAYDHYVPAVVDDLSSRPEFYTAYTPYQPEVSQGTLQVMYEFQSMICALTGMDVTNASMYEAGSAVAEAILLAMGHTRLNKVLLPDTLNERYRSIVYTYLNNTEAQIVTLPAQNFTIDAHALENELDEGVACIVVQSPNYFGFLEDVEKINALRQGKKTLLIYVYDPISLGVLKPPAAYDADIAVAEGQPLGNHLNFGGPYVGLFSVKQNLVRKIPGRLSGETVDVDGKRGYVLTLQTREQHIRREKATSNICTNSGLLVTRAAIYLTTLGKSGLQKVSQLSLQKAHYLADQLTQIPGVELASDQPFFKEFTVKLPKPAKEVIAAFAEQNMLAGIDLAPKQLPNHLLIAVTEKRSKEQLDRYVQTMRTILS